MLYYVYLKGKPCKSGIKFLQLCEAESGFVHSIEIHAGTHLPDTQNNTACSVDRLWQQMSKGFLAC